MAEALILEQAPEFLRNSESLGFGEAFDRESDSSTLHLLHSDETESYSQVRDSQALLADAVASQSECRREFLKRLAYLILESDFEFGFSTPADDYVRDALVSYGVFAREWMNDLFLRSFCRPHEASGILRVIAHFEYHQMYPQGVTIAVAALRHHDAAVRECGIRCFENWEEPSCLPILRSLEIEEDWLREYLRDVISDLEGLRGHVAAG